MSRVHRAAVRKQFGRTVEAFSKLAVRDAPEVLAEKLRFIRPQSEDLALDVACGPGTLVLDLAKRTRFARGIDVTKEMLRQARAFQTEAQVSNATFDCGEAEQLPYGDAFFDLVTCQCALHHMPQPERAIREMVRVMKPDGRLALIDTLAPEGDAKFELFNRIEILRDPSHTRTIRWTSFRALFEENRLKLVDEKIRRRERPFSAWMRRAGLEPDSCHYQEIRRLLERSIPNDQSGLTPRPQGDDLTIIHNEGMFLLTRQSTGSS